MAYNKEVGITYKFFRHPLERHVAYKFASINVNGSVQIYTIPKNSETWIKTNFKDFNELIDAGYIET